MHTVPVTNIFAYMEGAPIEASLPQASAASGSAGVTPAAMTSSPEGIDAILAQASSHLQAHADRIQSQKDTLLTEIADITAEIEKVRASKTAMNDGLFALDKHKERSEIAIASLGDILASLSASIA